ncbi:MAG: ATP-dependent helicase [Candidatus Paceibacterota bacterium]
MPFTQSQINSAKTVQNTAAHDNSNQIRLVAGPGTGKSYSIGERVSWLLNNGTTPESIFAVSFTRASAEDLKEGVFDYCSNDQRVNRINVSTLHSLALRVLARGGRLTNYPVSPRVLDTWEQRNIFDEELKASNGFPIKRCGELRTHFEAIWSTGNPPLPYISSPNPAISQSESTSFKIYHSQRSQLYGCILPGESVRQCVDSIRAGSIDPVQLLNIEHLIVDEYQDLNNCDIEFVDLLANAGVTIFVSGDDDQSIYSFRYASPSGIQTFAQRFTNPGDHALQLCFRCTPSVLSSASNLLAHNSPSTRINKSLSSAYSNSLPPVCGHTIGLEFQNHRSEAKFIAQSISSLVQGGLNPEDILILLSSRGAQLPLIESELSDAGINFDVRKNLELANHKFTRFVYALIRIIKNSDDYLAYRTLLGTRSGVGIRTCDNIAEKIITNNLNFKDQFTNNRSDIFFKGRELNALTEVESIKNQVDSWALSDTIGQRVHEITEILENHLTEDESNYWSNWIADLPHDATFEELESILASRDENEAREKLSNIYSRLSLPLPDDLNPAGRVRIMTLHLSKGLSAKIAFIPGMEEELIPGPYRRPYPGQVQEAARLLYVGITRARAACIISYSRYRVMNGSRIRHSPSRFVSDLGITFQNNHNGISQAQITDMLSDCNDL